MRKEITEVLTIFLSSFPESYESLLAIVQKINGFKSKLTGFINVNPTIASPVLVNQQSNVPSQEVLVVAEIDHTSLYDAGAPTSGKY